MEDLSDIINYALKKAIGDHNTEMMQKCIDRGAVVVTDMLISHIRAVGQPTFSHNDYRGVYNSQCPIFNLLISNISDIIPKHIMELYVCHSNPYYLETILQTKKFHSDPELLSYALSGNIPQYTIDLLIEHKFGGSELDAIIVGTITEFNNDGLSRLIAARVNLLLYQQKIFTFFTTSYKQNPYFTGLTNYSIPDYYIKRTFQLLIDYLTSNPYSAMHYLMVQYLRDNTLFAPDAFLVVPDIAKCIWGHYLSITTGLHSDYINFYQSTIRGL